MSTGRRACLWVCICLVTSGLDAAPVARPMGVARPRIVARGGVATALWTQTRGLSEETVGRIQTLLRRLQETPVEAPWSDWLPLGSDTSPSTDCSQPGARPVWQSLYADGTLQNLAAQGGVGITDDMRRLVRPRVAIVGDGITGTQQASVAPLTDTATGRFLSVVSGRLHQVRGTVVPMNSLLSLNGSAQVRGVDSAYDVNPLGPTLSLGQGSGGCGGESWGLWGRVYGLVGDREARPGVTGYGYDVWGGGLGLDREVAGTWLVGLTTGYARAQARFDDRAQTEFGALYAGLYTSAEGDHLYLDTILAVALLGYDSRRPADGSSTSQALAGTFDGRELSAYVETGYRGGSAAGWSWQPLAACRYARIGLDPYTETGAEGQNAQRLQGQAYDTLRGSLGLRLTRGLPGGAGRLTLRGRWNHEFVPEQSLVRAAPVLAPEDAIDLMDPSRPQDGGLVGAGLVVAPGEGLRLLLDYGVRFSSADRVQLLTAAAELRW